MHIVRYVVIFLVFCFVVAAVAQGFENASPASLTGGGTNSELFHNVLALAAGVVAAKIMAKVWKHPDTL